MTKEQYNRAVEINKRLKRLNDMKEKIKDTLSNLVLYCSDNSGHCSDLKMSPISEIIYHHGKQIRAEIDAEIEKLKKEIEEL